MTDPTDKEQYLNIADQCAATATSDLAASILVDGGNGTLRQLLNDAADAIRAGWATPQPTQAQVVNQANRPFIVRLAEDFAEECVTAGYVTTKAASYGRLMDEALSTQAQAGAVPLTDREIELIDGMIQVQLDHASRCDAIANRSMADKQKGWDMERVALLQKFKAHGIKGGQHGAE